MATIRPGFEQVDTNIYQVISNDKVFVLDNRQAHHQPMITDFTNNLASLQTFQNNMAQYNATYANCIYNNLPVPIPYLEEI